MRLGTRNTPVADVACFGCHARGVCILEMQHRHRMRLRLRANRAALGGIVWFVSVQLAPCARRLAGPRVPVATGRFGAGGLTLPASRVVGVSVGIALRGAALALLLGGERHEWLCASGWKRVATGVGKLQSFLDARLEALYLRVPKRGLAAPDLGGMQTTLLEERVRDTRFGCVRPDTTEYAGR